MLIKMRNGKLVEHTMLQQTKGEAAVLDRHAAENLAVKLLMLGAVKYERQPSYIIHGTKIIVDLTNRPKGCFFYPQHLTAFLEGRQHARQNKT